VLEVETMFGTAAGSVELEVVDAMSWRIEFGGSLSSLVDQDATLQKFVEDLQRECGADATVERLCAGPAVARITTPRK
jgi:hypothetical protein